MMRVFRCAVAALIATLVLGSQARADTVEFTLKQGSDGGFGFSWLHPAAGSSTGFSMNGDPKSRIDGTFSGEWNGASNLLTGINGVFTTQNTNINAYLGANNSEQITVKITDGRLRGGLGTNGLPGGDLAGGYMTYEIWGSDNGKLDDGQFSFYTRDFSSGDPDPNSLDYPSPGHDFALWGNNWVNTDVAAWDNIAASLGAPGVFSGQPDGTDPNFLRLGTDLRGPGVAQPIPEPGTWALIGIVALFAGYRRRKAS